MSANEIQLVVPLSALPPDTELTAAGILATIGEAEKQRAAAEQWKERYNQVAAMLAHAGVALEDILFQHAYQNEFDKVRAVRQFIGDLKAAGAENMKAE